MRASLEDVAAVVGVSTATVSRALRGLPRVSAQTRDKVLAAATELGYVASPAASRLASGKTGTVGVVVPYVDRWFFSRVIVGLESVLRQAGLDLLLYNLGGEDGRTRFFDEMPVRRRVDALVLLSLPLGPAELVLVHDLRVPAVAVGAEHPGIGCVRIDDRASGAVAMRHLMQLGHRDIAFIGGGTSVPMGFTAPLERRAAYLDVLAEHAVEYDPAFDIDGDFTPLGGEAAMSRILGGRRRPTAVFAASDDMAFGALRAIRRSGLRVPQDISLIGFDDHELADLVELSTIAQPVVEQGVAAAEQLLDRLAGTDAPNGPVLLPTRLVLRGSTAPPARH